MKTIHYLTITVIQLASFAGLHIGTVVSEIATLMPEFDPVPYCDYKDPVLQEVPVQGGTIVQTCRNIVPPPANALPLGQCSYFYCDFGGEVCQPLTYKKYTRTRITYSVPGEATLYGGPASDTPQPDCCICKMRPVPPQFVPAAE